MRYAIPLSRRVKHWQRLKEQGLELMGEFYEIWEKKRGGEQLQFYKALQKFVVKHKRISVRQFFYYLASQPSNSSLHLDISTSQKSRNAYQKVKTICRNSRLAGIIPMDAIVDETDLLGTPQYPYPIETFLAQQVKHYRSNWFQDQNTYVEVWLEKRALSKIFNEVTDEYGVLLSVGGKNPTWSQITSATKRFNQQHKTKNVILYFGDLDPAGKDMPRFLRQAFPKLGFTFNLSIEEIAINVPDIQRYKLPTIPLKKGDKRIKWFKKTYGVDYGIEIDALSPDVLRNKIRDSIEKHLDTNAIALKNKEDDQAKTNVLRVLKQISCTEEM